MCTFSQRLQLVDITLSFTMKMGIKKTIKTTKMILTPASTSGTNTAGQRTDSGGKRVLLLDLGGVLGLTSTGTLATSGVARSSSSALFIIDDIILYFNTWWNIQGSSKKHCSEVYRGPRAFSEPESRALRDFILARQISFYLLSKPGRYLSIFYQSQADILLSFIKARQISFYLRSWPGRYPFIVYQSQANFL